MRSYFAFTGRIAPGQCARFSSVRMPKEPARGEAPTTAMDFGAIRRSSCARVYAGRSIALMGACILAFTPVFPGSTNERQETAGPERPHRDHHRRLARPGA